MGTHIQIHEEVKVEEHFTFLTSHFTPSFSFRTFIDQDDLRVFAVRINGELLGVSVIKVGNSAGLKSSHFLYTRVKDTHHQHGINMMLKKVVEQRLQSEGYQRVSVCIRQCKQNIQRILRLNGYRFDRHFNKRYSDGEKKLRFIKYLV